VKISEQLKTLGEMTAEQTIALARKHTIFDWSVQSQVDTLAVSRAKGVYFWTVDGKRYLDFNSQLMCVNIGHGDERVVRAIAEQAAKLSFASPFLATEPRAQLGLMLAQLTPGDIDTFFFTLGGAEANEHAVKIARMVTGRHKILTRYRSYHGATLGAITLTGDSRRWIAEPGIPGVVHVLDPYHGIEQGWDDTERSLAMLDETIRLEGPHTIAAFMLEPIPGANGVLVPPPGYLEGVRELCTKYGILMVCDEVMSGFGRTGEWFAVDHWNVVPDIMTIAKGITSAYVPLGAVCMRRELAEFFRDRMFVSGLTYNSLPLACAAAVANLNVYLEDDLVARAKARGELMHTIYRELERRHPCVGAARSIGLFGAIELVKNPATREPLVGASGASPVMAAFMRFLREEGLYTMNRGHTFFTNPPLCIDEGQLREGFEIIDRGLRNVDEAIA
jgi:taurine--2-oxoglutarate transaminase